MDKQYALGFPEGHIASYPSRGAALAAQERMRRWPTTKWLQILVRDVGPWRPA